jgi:hypothetical protein
MHDDVVALLNAEDAGWTFLSSFNSGPGIGSDKSIMTGLFLPGESAVEAARRRSRDFAKSLETSVSVEVHQMFGEGALKRFVRGRSPLPPDYTRRRYHLGDESWLTEHTSGQYAISFRRGMVGGRVSGRQLQSIERIARILVDYIGRVERASGP